MALQSAAEARCLGDWPPNLPFVTSGHQPQEIYEGVALLSSDTVNCTCLAVAGHLDVWESGFPISIDNQSIGNCMTNPSTTFD